MPVVVILLRGFSPKDVVIVAEISHIVYQMPDVFIIFDREKANKDNHAYFSGENSTVKLLLVSIF